MTDSIETQVRDKMPTSAPFSEKIVEARWSKNGEQNLLPGSSKPSDGHTGVTEATLAVLEDGEPDYWRNNGEG